MKSLLLDYSETRIGENITFFEYDFEQSLNIVKIEGKKKVFIETDRNDIFLLTKTKVKQESDDNNHNILELQTKTEVRQERDDENNTILDFQTKTLVKQERDDESFSNN